MIHLFTHLNSGPDARKVDFLLWGDRNELILFKDMTNLKSLEFLGLIQHQFSGLYLFKEMELRVCIFLRLFMFLSQFS